METKHYIVKGRVQGVSFRANTQAKANALGVQGWVKNCMDGSVEVFASAAPEVLNEFEIWLKQGPAFARVDELQVNLVEAEMFEGFSIRF